MARTIQSHIEIEGKEYKPVHLLLKQFADWHHHFEVTFLASAFGDHDEHASLEDVKNFIGSDIKIIIKSEEEKNKQELLFIGVISDLSLLREFGGPHEIGINGYSSSLKIEDGEHSRSFCDRTLKQVIDTVLQPYEIESKINPKIKEAIPYLTQYKETNYNFLSRLANSRGEWFYDDGQKLHFGDFATGPEIEFQLGGSSSHHEISLRLSPANFVFQSYSYQDNKLYTSKSNSVNIEGLDPMGQEAMKASEKLFSEESLIPTSQPVFTQKELDHLVKSRKAAYATDMVTVSGDSTNLGIQLGTKIKLIEKKGKEATMHLVTFVSHSLDGNGNYKNHFEAVPASIKFPPRNRRAQQPSAETQVAVVREIGDPDGLGRVRVQFHWQKSGETTHWIRVLYPHAGAGHVYFAPEVGDEVLIGFEFDNPDRPFVMGSLYQGAAPPAYFTQDNSIKAIHTKDGNRIIMIDGDKGKIRILNKDDKNEITLSLEEEGKITIKTEGKISMEAKTIEMKAEEIKMNADTLLEMKSGQDATLEAQKIAVEAQMSLEQKGTEVKIEAQANAEVKASATVKVQGGAMAEIKGGMVMIN